MKKLFLIGCLILLSSCQPAGFTPPAVSPSSTNAELISTATLTPAPTSTLTNTPAPTSIPLFFTEEFNTDLAAWTFFQTGGEQAPVAVLKNDQLNIQMDSPNSWYYAIHTAHEYSGVFISAKFSAQPAGSIGLVCNYSQAEGWYEFNITHEGTYNVLMGKWLAEGVAQYRPLLNGSSEYLQVGNLEYKIGFACADNVLWLYINDKMFRKLDVAHIGLTQGNVGINASSFDNVPMNTIFEWVKVKAPE